MARARYIKPAFFKNDELAELPFEDRLLFAGMWTIADCFGRFEYRPKRLKAEILPYDNVDIEQAVNNLAQYRFIRIYSVQGQRYIQVENFAKHQHPHKNEIVKGSEIPAPDSSAENIATDLENKGETEEPEKIGTSPESISTDPPFNLNLIPLTLNKKHIDQTDVRSVSEKKSSKSIFDDSDKNRSLDTEEPAVIEQPVNPVKKSKSTKYPEAFESFWRDMTKIYQASGSNPGSKPKALSICKKLNPDQPTRDAWLSAARSQLEQKKLKRARGEFAEQFSHVYRWLRDERYSDPVDLASAPQGKPAAGSHHNFEVKTDLDYWTGGATSEVIQ